MQRWFLFSSLAILAMFMSPWSCARAYQVNPASYDIQKIARLDQKYSSKSLEQYGPNGSYKKYNPDYDDWMYYVKEPRYFRRPSFRRVYSEDEFSYNEVDKTGPSRWKYLNSNCGGQRQSPIPIETCESVTVPNAEPFEVYKFDSVPVEIKLENTGHSMKFTPKYKAGELPMMAGGPLNGFFVLDHVHLHWGLTNDRGSEHTIDGERYPCEIHIVTYDGRYSSFDEALNQQDSIAVLMFMIEIGPPTGPLFLAPYLPNIVEAHSEFTLDSSNSFSLQDLIGSVEWNILSYKGSLTTPPCTESVIWVINDHPIYMRVQEIEALRELKFDNGQPMGNNYRPLQSTNFRKVYYYPEK